MVRVVLLDKAGNYVNRIVIPDDGKWTPPEGHTIEDAKSYDHRKVLEGAAADKARLEAVGPQTAEDYRLLMRAYRLEGNPAEEKRVYLEAQEALKNGTPEEKRAVKWKGDGPAPTRAVGLKPRG